MTTVLKVENLHTHIRESHILQGVSFEAEHGKATVILGRNGVGKTVLFKSIINAFTPSEGHVFYKGEEITRIPTYRVIRRGIAFVPSSMGVFTGLTVRENLWLAYRGERSEFSEKVSRIFETFPELERAYGRSALSLSGGEREMLAISCGIINRVELLMLDEPSEGLSPLVVKKVMESLNKLKRETTILLVEQNFSAAKLVGDECYFMDKGQIVYHTKMDSLNKDSEVLRKYLGVAF